MLELEREAGVRSFAGNQQETVAPAGSWLLPGGFCNLVVPRWGMQKKKKSWKRGLQHREAPGSAWNILHHLPN